MLSPKDPPSTDGLDLESYKDVEIASTCFSVGDNRIAVEPGEIYVGSTYKCPSENISTRRCCMRDGHGSVTIGNEMVDGVKGLTVKDRIFLHTDRGLRIKMRRDRGRDAVMDEIVFEHTHVDHVMIPFVINYFYFCSPGGHSEYAHTEGALPVDNKMSFIRSLRFRDVEAGNCYAATAHMYSLPEQRIGRVEMERVHVNYVASTREGQSAMMDDCDSRIYRMRIYADQAEELVLKDVEVEGQDGPAIITENIGYVCGNI